MDHALVEQQAEEAASAKARALAARLGLITAAYLPARPKPPPADGAASECGSADRPARPDAPSPGGRLGMRESPGDHERLRQRWSPQRRLAFDTLAPCALCVVATDGPVSLTLYDALGGVTRLFGHNRGVWPARLARTSAWKDTVTAAYNKSPFVWTGTQIRVWTPSDAHERRLAMAVAERLAVMREEAFGAELLNGFVDLGPEVSWEMLELDIHATAERLGIPTWDDEALERHLDRLAAKAERASRPPGEGRDPR